MTIDELTDTQDVDTSRSGARMKPNVNAYVQTIGSCWFGKWEGSNLSLEFTSATPS